MKNFAAAGAVLCLAVAAWGQGDWHGGRPGKGNRQQQAQQQQEAQQQAQGQGQAQGQVAKGGAASASTGPQQNTQESVYQDVRQTAPALAPPPFHTSPCVKGWGAAGQTGWAGLGIGGGKVDAGCDIRETAEELRNAGSLLAFCKLMVTEPSARKAGVALEDCMTVKQPEGQPPAAMPPAPVESTPQIIVPAPQVTINIPQPLVTEPGVPLSAIRTTTTTPTPRRHPARKAKPCPTLEK